MAAKAPVPVTPDSGVFEDTRSKIKLAVLTELGAATSTVPKREVSDANRNNSTLVMTWVPVSVTDLVASKKRYLFGVSFAEVAAEALIQIATSRKLQAPIPLLRDLVFSIFVAYTVSRDWAVEYNNLHSSSVLRRFEIDGRQVDRNDPMFAKNGWVNTSKMNSTAAHMLGYLVVESAVAAGALKTLKDSKGTPFSDKKLKTPQGLLITEMASTLSLEDKDAQSKFEPQFRVLVDVISKIFGEAGLDLEDAFARAAAMRPSEF